MTKLKFLVSLLLALGLVACNGDDDETDDDYALKVGSISNVAKGGKFSVPVEVQKDSKTVTEGDGATLKVTVAINCKAKEATDTTARKEVKPTAKAAEKGKVTIEGTADDSWDVDDTCTAKATADGAKEATGTFKITAASDEGEKEEVDDKTPSFVPAAPKFGEEFKIKDGVGKKITLVAEAGGSNACPTTGNAASKLYHLNGTTLVEVDLGNGHTIAADDAFFVVGGSCKVTVTDITGEKTLSAQVADDAVAISSLDVSGANIVLNIPATLEANRESPMLFVKKGTTGWVHATIEADDWENTSRTLDSGVSKSTGEANTNHALLRTNGHWRYAIGG